MARKESSGIEPATINGEAGRPARGEILESRALPEIGYHRCKDGEVATQAAQGVKHRCFRCGERIVASALGPRQEQ